jgi:hypothetical protein
MAFSIRSIAFAGAVAIGLVVSGCQGACSSTKLPPAHSASDRAQIAAAVLPYSIAVERGDFPTVYAERLADALQRSRLFADVELTEQRKTPADLVARVVAPSEGAAVIPILTAITLGIFPTWAEETWGLRFSLAPPAATAAPVEIDFRWRGTTVLGWASALLNLLPDRSGADPTEGDRYAEHVAASIAPHAAAITALVESR